MLWEFIRFNFIGAIMRLIDASLLIVLTLLSHSFCFDIKCGKGWPSNQCKSGSLLITSQNEPITSVNGNTNPDASSRYVEWSNYGGALNFLPNKIAVFFPYLTHLETWYSKLERIEQSDIKELKALKYLILDNNNIEILEEGLFDFNIDLEYISIRENRLKFVHKNLLYRLTKLRTLYLTDNPCIDYVSWKTYNERDTVAAELNSKCQSWEAVLKVYGEKVSERNENINNLQLENEKLMHQLETCDLNLDLRQQKSHSSDITLTDKPDRPVIDLTCEHEKCVARSFKVSFPNLSIDNVFNKSHIIRSLVIHQQSTLYLPLSLAKHFHQLSELSVTGSGLFEIGYSVFEGLRLASLNLTRNQISKIPANTFSDMGNLHVLDLSFNHINSLFDDVFGNLKSLRRIYLNNNYLQNIKFDIFKNAKNLTGLFLQNNKLQVINTTFWDELNALESVDFSDNSCINMCYSTSTLDSIKTEIMRVCIQPIKFICRLNRNETTDRVRENLHCNVEIDQPIEFPKTTISMQSNAMQERMEHIEFFVADKQSIKFFPYHLWLQLPNLKRIEIQRSNLTSLHHLDFAGFSHLTEIVINYNNLSSISNDTFDTISKLQLLNLSSNAIVALPANIFANLLCLHTLIISDNQIVKLPADILPPHNVIKQFLVGNNQLEIIETYAFRYLNRDSFVDLSDNVCIDMQFVKNEIRSGPLSELFFEIYLRCSTEE